ncbi:MAG: transposase [Cupriavidus sp.]|nr:transposase [Cupriavidus sp.]
MKTKQNLEAAEVSREPRRRRRRTPQEKVLIVRETFEAEATVSAVARRHQLNSSQLFTWRKQYQEGRLNAVPADQTVGPASLVAALKEIQTLRRLLGKKTLENELLREVAEYGRGGNWQDGGGRVPLPDGVDPT